jgi:putative phosphoribosyl transferase
MHQTEHLQAAVRIPAGDVWLRGDLGLPHDARGLVLFAHESGGDRHSPRYRIIAQALEADGFAALLIDLLTPAEVEIDRQTAQFRFDIERLAGPRLASVVDWLGADRRTSRLPIGLFGAGTGAAAALVAAALRPDAVAAVVASGGRSDLAGMALRFVTAPTLFIAGERDTQVIELNRAAMAEMTGEVRLAIVPGATHLFQEPGALNQVAVLVADWFATHLALRDPVHL